MDINLQKRAKSFVWRAGGFIAVAAGAYLANIGDIREIDLYKLGTIVVVTLAAYVVNEVTKMLNSQS